MARAKLKHLIAFSLAITAGVSTHAQTAAAPPQQLSPKAAYDEAMQPLTTTRAQVSNWSDSEIAALKVSIALAAEACAARPPADFNGAPLVDLAKLCALGQSWPAVVKATTRYIVATAPKPLLAEAYAAQIDANLHLKNEPAALSGARDMLATVPYDALTRDAIDEVLTYTQFANTPDAVALARLRQPQIIAALHAATAPSADAAATTVSTSATAETQSIHALYSDGLVLAALQQLAGEINSAAQTVAALDAAVPTPLTSDDILPITAARRRYALLGRGLPNLHATGYLRAAEPMPRIPANNAITALLLFPDWCAQCVRMGQSFPETVFTVAGHEAYLYGMLAQTVPPAKVRHTDAFDPADASLFLAGTPTLSVPASVLDHLAVDSVPFLLLTDAHGIVRVAQPIDPSAIQPGNTIDTAIACVGAYWPLRSTPAQVAQTPSDTQKKPRKVDP